MDDILIEDYDPRWPERFLVEAAHIRTLLGEDLILELEHIGSTAIPGLAAKPILDILVTVRSLPDALTHIPALEALGYSFWRANPRKEHLFLVKGLPPNGPRTHHLHIVEPGEDSAARLTFRDYLRTHLEDARRYQALKLELAERFRFDREAYTAGKTEFVREILDKAHQMASIQ